MICSIKFLTSWIVLTLLINVNMKKVFAVAGGISVPQHKRVSSGASVICEHKCISGDDLFLTREPQRSLCWKVTIMSVSMVISTCQHKSQTSKANKIENVTANLDGSAPPACNSCLLLPPSQNICTCWLLRFTFDHSSYSKKLWKCYLFCYEMFYHRIYFKYIIIVSIFSQIFWIRRMVKCDMYKSKGANILGWRE
jgi:hypothetical protein